MFNRRSLLAGATALGGASLLPTLAYAKGSVAAAIYPGTWEEAFRAIVAPALKTKDAVGRASPRAGRPAAASQDNPAEQPFSLVRCRHLGPDEAWPTGLTDRP